MDISYRGGSSFLITGDTSISLDPTTEAGKDVLVLHTKRQKAAKHRVSGPGEYEISGVLVVTFPVGGFRSEVLAHAFEVSGINILHISGNVTIEPTDLESIGRVDVLMVDTSDLKAAETLAREVAPRVVIPFGKHGTELVATLGVKDPQPVARFVWNGSSAVPRAVLLKETSTRTRAA